MIQVSGSAGAMMRHAVECTGKRLKDLYAVILPGAFWVGTEENFKADLQESLIEAAIDTDVDADAIKTACEDLLGTPFNGMLRTLVFDSDVVDGKTKAHVLFISLYGNGAA